jgi:uncharacterized protein YbjT (DUF2867 family)
VRPPVDIAAVAALALTPDGHEGKEYVLTGDEAFTVAEQVQILAESLGRDIEVREAATSIEALLTDEREQLLARRR